MGNKTLYIKDKDEAMLKELEEISGESYSALFARLAAEELERLKKKQTEPDQYNDPTYSITETALIFTVPTALLYRMIKKGRIPVIRMNSRKLVPGWRVRQKLAEPKR